MPYKTDEIDDLIAKYESPDDDTDSLIAAFGAPAEASLGSRIKQSWENIGEAAADNAKTPTQIEKLGSVVGRTIAFPFQAGLEAAKSIPSGNPKVPLFGFRKDEHQTPNMKWANKKIGSAAKAVSGFLGQHPRASTLAETGVNLIGAVPVVKAISGGAPALGKAAASILEKGSARIQGTKVKINSPEFKKGAQNEMYPKHEVFGNAEKVRGQWQNKIEATSAQVKERIQNLPDVPENYASIDDIFNAADKSAETYGKSNTAKAAIKNSLAKLKEEFQTAYPEGRINILDAQSEKQVIGKKGDWLARSGEISGNPEAAVNSQAHNALYDALKINVENKGAPGIKELNKQLSEFIPMERAAAKQVLVANRKNLIPLDAFIGGIHAVSAASHLNPLPALLTVATMGTRSPLVAKGLHAAAKGLKRASEPLGKRKIVPDIEHVTGEVGIFRTTPPDFQRQLGGRDRLALPAPSTPRLGLPDRSSKQLEPPGKYSDKESEFTMPGGVFPAKNVSGKRGKVENTSYNQLPRDTERALRYRQNRLSPEEADIEAMDRAYAEGYKPNEQIDFLKEQETAIRKLKNKYFGSVEEIKPLSKLSDIKQKEVRALAEEININPDVRNAFIKHGIIGQEDNVHPDDVIMWFNSVGKRKK